MSDRGRPRKPENAANRRFRESYGYAHRNASISEVVRLERVSIAEGTLSAGQQDLVSGILRSRSVAYAGKSAIGGRARRLLSTGAERDFRQLVATFNMSVLETAPVDEPWVLDTRGGCGWHRDSVVEMSWTLLICVTTDEPYEMQISGHTGDTIYDNLTWRTVKMTPGSYVIFPAKMWHRCEAAETNGRRIINTACKK